MGPEVKKWTRLTIWESLGAFEPSVNWFEPDVVIKKKGVEGGDVVGTRKTP
jgi:hypothetical protein